MKRYTAVKVTWVDAHTSADAWTARENLELTDRVIGSVGWLVHHDAKHVVLAMSSDKTARSVDMTLTIPTQCVLTIRKLK